MNGITYSLGSYKNEQDAAKVYNQQALFFNNTKNTKYILNDIPSYITAAKDVWSEKQTNKTYKNSNPVNKSIQ